MGRSYVLVEGYGETKALPSLLRRLSADLKLPSRVWAEPIRSKRLATEAGIAVECERLRTKHDCEAALFFRDDEDGCPKDDAPQMAAWLRAQALPYPVAVVLAFREYETFFLASAASLAGRDLVDEGGLARPGLRAGARFEGNPEERRDAKGWLTEHFPEGRSYKPTVDQLPMTRLLDFGVLRASGLSSFRRLETALRFLAAATGPAVYPKST